MRLIEALIKHYWFSLLLLPVLAPLYYLNSFDPTLAKELLLRKTTIALYSLLLAYIIRRLIIGYVSWQGEYRYVYAIVIHIIVALAIIFG
ncbi:TPA: putative holin [Thermocrinis Great Boiling Spring virus]|nr:TPA: putative holin [Thermocrinis Great Boiling Spring virus]